MCVTRREDIRRTDCGSCWKDNKFGHLGMDLCRNLSGFSDDQGVANINWTYGFDNHTMSVFVIFWKTAWKRSSMNQSELAYGKIDCFVPCEPLLVWCNCWCVRVWLTPSSSELEVDNCLARGSGGGAFLRPWRVNKSLRPPDVDGPSPKAPAEVPYDAGWLRNKEARSLVVSSSESEP